MPTTHYDTHETSSTGDYESNPEIKFRPYTTIDATLDSAFASDGEWGQSLSVNFTDVELVDGTFYVNANSGKYTLFSWKNVAEMSPVDRYDRGQEPSVEDAPEIVTRTYFGDTYEYELVAARVPEIMDDDNNVAVEATSKARDVTLTELDEWDDLSGDKVELPDVVHYFDANEDNGASVTSTATAEVLTTAGEDAIDDADDMHNWLNVPMGENILRDDLEGREIQFFIVQRDSDETGYSYNLPIFVDLKTGERIQANNRSQEADSGNRNPEESEAVQEAVEQDAGTYPEPLAEFISSGRDLDLNANRAASLLDDMIEDGDNALTAAMVDDHGGRDAIIGQVV